MKKNEFWKLFLFVSEIILKNKKDYNYYPTLLFLNESYKFVLYNYYYCLAFQLHDSFYKKRYFTSLKYHRSLRKFYSFQKHLNDDKKRSNFLEIFEDKFKEFFPDWKDQFENFLLLNL